jgi:signal transduction histidine kinase
MIGVDEQTSVDIGRAFQDALTLFEDIGSVKVENQCLGTEVMADSLLIDVFHNLLGCSLKNREKLTSIRVFVEKDKKSFRIYYTDDGVGFDQPSKEHLFERLARKDTGFSLFLVREISTSYGWTVEEIGQKDVGVRFEFIIPVEKVKKFTPVA